MKTSDQLDQISVAMSKAQADIKPAPKDAANPFFRSRYTTLAGVWEACRGPLTANGLSVWQDVTVQDGAVQVCTRLAHSSGQWVEFGPLAVPLVKHDPQTVGSATSYGKRYALSAAVGIVADEDDDGEAAMGRNGHKAKDEPLREPTLSKAKLDEIMAVAKAQYGGKGISEKRVMAHLNGIAKGLKAPDIIHLAEENVSAAIDAIKNGSDPE